MSHQSNQAAELHRFLQSAQQPVWNVIHILQHFFIFWEKLRIIADTLKSHQKSQAAELHRFLTFAGALENVFINLEIKTLFRF